MPQPNDLSRSLVAVDQNSTIIAVIELSQSSWLVGGVVPGIERQPRKKLEPSPERLLAVLHRWRDEAVRAGRTITRIALAFEAGRDGFWLARWLERRGVEAHVIHPSSVAVSREHRRAETDRLDTELGFLGWLRGERGHCTMVRVPTIAEEDAPDHRVKRFEGLFLAEPLDPLYEELQVGLDRTEIDALGIVSWHEWVVIVWHVGSRQSRGCEAEASQSDAASPRSMAM